VRRASATSWSARAVGNVRLIGPNSVGIINTGASLDATFAAAQPRRYPVALLSQSGAVATAILDWARTTGMGFSKFVSLGNMADVNEVEILEYLAADPETKTVVVYLEGLSNGRAFLDAARSVTRTKPVVAMKVGRSLAGAPPRRRTRAPWLRRTPSSMPRSGRGALSARTAWRSPST